VGSILVHPRSFLHQNLSPLTRLYKDFTVS